MDRACQDIETEIRKLAPEGKKINPATLAKATIATNALLRRKGISAFEMHTSRSQDTGSNLLLDDAQIHAEQIKSRKSSLDVQSPDIKVGDTVTSVSSQQSENYFHICIALEPLMDETNSK